jgi:anti-sigma regulatory factor (Ser/Thr protein kinase)
MHTDAKITVRSDPSCVAAARRLVSERCGALPAGVDLGAIELMVSELVTNVIRHTPTGDGELRLLLGGRTIRVEVEDQGDGAPTTLSAPDREYGGGFGLHMVDRLSHRWGVERRNCVWFEMDVDRRRGCAGRRKGPRAPGRERRGRLAA